MEGPPLRSSSRPAANANCCTDDDQRTELGENYGSLVYEDSVNNSAATTKTPRVYAKRCIKTLAELRAQYAGEPVYKGDDKTMESLNDDKHDYKAMDSSWNVKAVESSNDKAVESLYNAEASNADHFYGIYDNSHGSIGIDHEDICIGSLTNKKESAELNGDGNHQFVQQPNELPAAGNISALPLEIMSVEAQAVRQVDDAKAAYQQLQAAVNTANEMLKKMSKPSLQISEDIMAVIEVCLTDSPGWFLSILEGRNQRIDDLSQNLNETIIEKDELQLKLDESQKFKGLSAGEKLKLRSLGVDNLNDLIANYRQLQIQLSSAADIKVSRNVSRSKEDCLQKNIILANGDSMESSERTSCIPIPMPDKFTGKTRVELERYLRYFDRAVMSRGYPDSDKAIIIGNYIPSLQYTHDKLIRKNSSYLEIKAGLLNALGVESDVATFALRTSLDRIKKPDDKLYKELLEDVEKLVTQAFNDDNDQGDVELKKILIRLTEEDSNSIFGSTIIPHLSKDYTRLKELVLGVEAALLIKKQTALQLKRDLRSSSSNENEHSYPQFHKRFDPPRSYPNKDIRWSGGNQRDKERTIVQSSTTEVEKYPYNPPCSSPSKQNNGSKPLVCYKCEKPGHYARDCSEPDVQGVRQVKHIENYGLNGVVNIGNIAQTAEDIQMCGKKPVLDIFLDTVKVDAVLDSGACASVISEATLVKILKQRPKGIRRIEEEDPELFMKKRLVSANGSPLTVVNCLKMPISWGNNPPKLAKFFIVSELQQDVLIGTNVLQGDTSWIKALGIALRSNTANDGYCNVKKFNGVGCVMPQKENGIADRCNAHGIGDNFELYREKFNIVSCYCKNFIVKDGKCEAHSCSNEMDAVAEDVLELKFKKRNKKNNRHDSTKENAPQSPADVDINWRNRDPASGCKEKPGSTHHDAKALGTQKMVRNFNNLGSPNEHEHATAAQIQIQHESSSKEFNDRDRISIRHQNEYYGFYKNRGRHCCSKSKWSDDPLHARRSTQRNRGRHKEHQ
uniref:CCHC-type domain-containing protein n=1 Tax=Panagrolaimus sp. ES5 TaxID=591445 RepID=A0AC34FZG2_9BILA